MSDRNFQWVRVKGEKGLGYLRHRLRELYHYNTWTEAHRDRKGNRICLVIYDWKPDSDWGKTETQLGVWFANEGLYERGMKLIRDGAHEGKPFEDNGEPMDPDEINKLVMF